jgi:ferredoxin-NADP reductase
MYTEPGTKPNVLRRLLGSSIVETMTAPHGVDRYLELINPRWSVREVRGQVADVRHQTADTVTLTVEPNGNWLGHRAGQWVRVGVEIDGVVRTRCYSIATSAKAGRTDGAFELTIKAQAGGAVSPYLVAHAEPGMVLRLSQADGEFTLPTERPERLVLVSGGSGITPVLSMLRTLCDEGHDRPVAFVHYSFGPDDALYVDEVAALAQAHPNVRVVRAYTEASAGADLHGLFAPAHLDHADPAWRDAEVYVCGPTGLMDAVGEALRAAGCGERLHEERFAAPAIAPLVADGSGDPSGALAFARTGTTVASSGGTVLDQAEAAGLTPDAGCRMGICHTCTAPKTSGCVRNVLTGELSDAGEQDIQICISIPVGDVVVDL